MPKATTRTKLGQATSEGTRRLWLAMEARGWGQTDLATALDRKTDAVSRLLYGERRPGLELALRIRDVLGIEPEVWSQKPLKPFVPFTLAPEYAPTGTSG